MSQEAYEILALFMRYIFVVIGALIVWRSYRWLVRDARAYRREMRSLPDAGLVGEMVDLQTGQAQPLPREGVIGASRACDIRVKGPGVLRTHARFAFEDGRGLKITPCRRARVLLGGQEVRAAGYALHGSQLEIGPASLRVRLFAGLDVPHPAAYQDMDTAPAPEETEAYMPYTAGEWTQSTSEGQYAPYEPGQYSAMPPSPAPAAYDGRYTDDGQMTWQYAYSLNDLHEAMENQGPARQAEEPEAMNSEGLPYESPVKRHRRSGRHA